MFNIELRDNDGKIIATQRCMSRSTMTQLLFDMAEEHNVYIGEGYFNVYEDGVLLNKHDIPRY